MAVAGTFYRNFRFRYVSNGNIQGLKSLEGKLFENMLLLGNNPIALKTIDRSYVRNDLVIISFKSEVILTGEAELWFPDGKLIVLATREPKAFVKDLNRLIADAEIRENKPLRISDCPSCEASLDVSLVDEGQKIYCKYCETISDERSYYDMPGYTWHFCDSCGLFGRNRNFRELYFYFILFFWGFSSRKKHLCDNCADKLFWKTLIMNLLFVIGIVPSILLKLRALKGRTEDIRLLMKGNRFALRGDWEQAEACYNRMRSSIAGHPAVLVNRAQAYFIAGKAGEAHKCLNQALSICPNYEPARSLSEKSTSPSLFREPVPT